MAARKKAAPKRGASRYQEPAKKPVHPLVWVVLGLVVGVFIMSLLKLEPGKDHVKRETAKPAASPSASQPQTATSPESSANKPKYEFYTLLPESEVIVPPDALPEKAPPPPSAREVEAKRKAEAARAQALLDGKQPPPAPPRKEVTQFYLQAGSFPEREKAEAVRARLLLTGQNVHIEPGQVANRTWYRVLVGPFASREQLNTAQTQLSHSGFNNLLLQQRKARM